MLANISNLYTNESAHRDKSNRVYVNKIQHKGEKLEIFFVTTLQILASGDHADDSRHRKFYFLIADQVLRTVKGFHRSSYHRLRAIKDRYLHQILI